MPCQTCRDNLDLIAVDELAGRDILHRYPALVLHLTGCGACRAAYLQLRETLRSESQEEVQLMFAAPTPVLSSPETPWKRVEGPAGPFPLRFELARGVISRALRGPQLTFARGEDVSTARTALLLADLMETEQGAYVTEVTLHRYITRPDLIDLEIRLVNEAPLPAGLTVRIACADVHRSAPVVEGEPVTFRDLPLARLTHPQTGEVRSDLTLTFISQ